GLLGVGGRAGEARDEGRERAVERVTFPNEREQIPGDAGACRRRGQIAIETERVGTAANGRFRPDTAEVLAERQGPESVVHEGRQGGSRLRLDRTPKQRLAVEPAIVAVLPR